MHITHIIYVYMYTVKIHIYIFAYKFTGFYTRSVIYLLTASEMPIRKVTKRGSCQNRTDLLYWKLNQLKASNCNKNNAHFLLQLKPLKAVQINSYLGLLQKMSKFRQF